MSPQGCRLQPSPFSAWLALSLVLEGSQCWLPEQTPGSMFLPKDHHLPLSPSLSVPGSWLSLVLALGLREQVRYHRATLSLFSLFYLETESY